MNKIVFALYYFLYNMCVIVQCGLISSAISMAPVTALVTVVMNLPFAILEIPTAG
jgi:hypothetical protein